MHFILLKNCLRHKDRNSFTRMCKRKVVFLNKFKYIDDGNENTIILKFLRN